MIFGRFKFPYWTYLIRFVQNTRTYRTQMWQWENFEPSDIFYGHEFVHALWRKHVGKEAFSHSIYLVYAILYNFLKPIDFPKTLSLGVLSEVSKMEKFENILKLLQSA